jgi:hypothetical protein
MLGPEFGLPTEIPVQVPHGRSAVDLDHPIFCTDRDFERIAVLRHPVHHVPRCLWHVPIGQFAAAQTCDGFAWG